ncbi:YhgE/Pip N-terminal domain-containing protein/YhgE/Pip C-terminal domain-containing protein [Terrisporobacter glycolicus]|nr:YhgE/Pip N-terminal domain-containing protein/YhgE/Pip C-terminal domain-containing protein [Terrisporobacter glycolicus]
MMDFCINIKNKSKNKLKHKLDIFNLQLSGGIPMKNIFKIFRDDLKDISTNMALIIVLIALAVLPSLYAWFNIEASWDPYGNTSNISVAVVNNDKGATLFEKDLNVGDKLIDELKSNNSLGWKFVNEEEAKKGVETGKYYASIEITPNFSKNIISVLSKDIHKAEIKYTVNEKINAIAPKITDKGASTIQLQVDQTVVKTASEAVFTTLNDLGISLEENLPMLTKIENSLIEVQGKFGKIDSILNTASDASSQISEISKLLQNDMPQIESTLKSSINLSKDVKEFLQATKSSMNDIAPTIKNDIKIINDISSSVASGVGDLITAIEKGYENAPELVDGLYNKVDHLLSISTKLSDFLTKLDKIAPGTSLQGTIDSINEINSKLNLAKTSLGKVKEQINNGEKPSLNNLNGIVTVLNDVNKITNNLFNNYDTKIVAPLNEIFNKGITVSNDVISLLEKAEDKLPKINNILGTAINLSGDADDAIDYIKKKVPEAESALNKLVSDLSIVNDSDEMGDLIKFLKNDIIKQSNFLKEPVELVTNSLYPMANYGAAMTPFYTVLCLWVGVLLLTSLLTTEVRGEYKSYQVYFGRGLTFLSIGLLQALIVSVGDIYLLGVTVKNPAIFILLSLFISLVFNFIVYSLVSVFGNIGKAMAVILLVIQVAGSGGTFPIQVTPKFFQNVNPFLPFTYGISALREAVAGIYEPNLTGDIVVLLTFLALAIVLNVLLKGPINKMLYRFTKRMEESRLTEH